MFYFSFFTISSFLPFILLYCLPLYCYYFCIISSFLLFLLFVLFLLFYYFFCSTISTFLLFLHLFYSNFPTLFTFLLFYYRSFSTISSILLILLFWYFYFSTISTFLLFCIFGQFWAWLSSHCRAPEAPKDPVDGQATNSEYLPLIRIRFWILEIRSLRHMTKVLLKGHLTKSWVLQFAWHGVLQGLGKGAGQRLAG